MDGGQGGVWKSENPRRNQCIVSGFEDRRWVWEDAETGPQPTAGRDAGASDLNRQKLTPPDPELLEWTLPRSPGEEAAPSSALILALETWAESVAIPPGLLASELWAALNH